MYCNFVRGVLKNEVDQIKDIDVKDYKTKIDNIEKDINEMNEKTVVVKDTTVCKGIIEKLDKDCHQYIQKMKKKKDAYDSLNSI